MRERSRPPARRWAAVELVLAVAMVVAGLQGSIPYSAVPPMLAVASAFLWWRGPGWRGVGLRRPISVGRVLTISIIAGVGLQFLGLYITDPLVARFITGASPDLSPFRSTVGDEFRLAFWLTMSWTLAAFMEEMVFRGWILNRLAEHAYFSTRAWVAAALGSSVLFGIARLDQGSAGVIANVLNGLGFAAVYVATGRNLWAAILTHGVLDTVAFVMIYFDVYPGL